MRVHLQHHEADAPLAATLAKGLTERGFVRAATPGEADVALLLVSRAALRDGLGTGPAEAVAAGIHVLPLLVGDDVLPPGFPVHRKHLPLPANAEAVVKHLDEERERGAARQIDSKRELFGLGLLLALLPRA